MYRHTQRGNSKIAGLRRFTQQFMEADYMCRGKETFDPLFEVEQIRARRAEARRKLYRKSRLDKYRVELILMRQAGASCADLAEWLRVNRRCKINRSSIDRYLRRISEKQTAQTGETQLQPGVSGKTT